MTVLWLSMDLELKTILTPKLLIKSFQYCKVPVFTGQMLHFLLETYAFQIRTVKPAATQHISTRLVKNCKIMLFTGPMSIFFYLKAISLGSELKTAHLTLFPRNPHPTVSLKSLCNKMSPNRPFWSYKTYGRQKNVSLWTISAIL